MHVDFDALFLNFENAQGQPNYTVIRHLNPTRGILDVPARPPASATSATADGLAPEGASQTKKFVIKKRPRKKVCLQVIKKRPRKPDVADVNEWCSAATDGNNNHFLNVIAVAVENGAAVGINRGDYRYGLRPPHRRLIEDVSAFRRAGDPVGTESESTRRVLCRTGNYLDPFKARASDLQYNARNCATLNCLQMLRCAGSMLSDPSFLSPRTYFTPLRRFCGLRFLNKIKGQPISKSSLCGDSPDGFKELRNSVGTGPDLPYGFLGFSPGPRGCQGPPAKSNQSKIDDMRKNRWAPKKY
ncbi:hypothetical protein EVAR_102944_1 [Eumeta japonica]|uniref:Uncharacterized protein n=1 Tax=Eumeta variegata TaxID=151549 RepID=A0A4C1URA6_EUMVA|nr:hypothetical protein EVAR_102944_1 [Eumeta japonica]